MICKSSRKFKAKHPYSGEFWDFKALNGHFPLQKAAYPVMSWVDSERPSKTGDVAAPDQGFLADSDVILLILPSFSCIEIGFFNPVRLAIYRLCPATSGMPGRTRGQRGYILPFLAKAAAIWWL
jgi:hypothetical protein